MGTDDLPRIDLTGVRSSDTAWQMVVSALDQVGINWICYLLCSGYEDTLANGIENSVVYRTNYPKEFLAGFEPDASFLSNDVAMLSAISGKGILKWHDPALLEQATPEQIRQHQMACQAGLKVGVTISASCYSSDAGGTALYSRHLDGAGFDQMWARNECEILTILAALNEAMKKTFIPETLRLSRRELDVLSWLAAGLRPDEIADQLNIGYRTVDKYISSAKVKLKARTRDHAVCRAINFGLLAV